MFARKGIHQAYASPAAAVRGVCAPQNQRRVAGKFCLKIVETHDLLVRLVPYASPLLLGEVKDLLQRLPHGCTREWINKEASHSVLNLVDKASDLGRRHNRPLLTSPQRYFEGDIGERLLPGRHHDYAGAWPLAEHSR